MRHCADPRRATRAKRSKSAARSAGGHRLSALRLLLRLPAVYNGRCPMPAAGGPNLLQAGAHFQPRHAPPAPVPPRPPPKALHRLGHHLFARVVGPHIALHRTARRRTVCVRAGLCDSCTSLCACYRALRQRRPPTAPRPQRGCSLLLVAAAPAPRPPAGCCLCAPGGSPHAAPSPLEDQQSNNPLSATSQRTQTCTEWMATPWDDSSSTAACSTFWRRPEMTSLAPCRPAAAVGLVVRWSSRGRRAGGPAGGRAPTCGAAQF